MNKYKEIFFNRAEVQEAQRIHCDKCFEQVVFMLKDKEHTFSIGLTTVIECLAFAIKNGDLPKLPISWLSDADSVLDTKLSFDEDVCYYDYETYKKRDENED